LYTAAMSKKSVALLGGALLVATACVESPATPDLVSASGLNPQSVEVGDTLQISGRGFPEGVPVRLSFRGDLFRAGKPPQRNAEIVVRTQDTSKDTITLAVNDEIEQAFCGAGDFATHATFRGEVAVAFAARSTGMAPVTGTLRNVSLEVQPRLGSYQVERERQRVASEALAFLGLSLDDSSASDCCTVATAQGRAQVAGLRPGDRLVDFDGVSVRRATDLVPSGRNRTARLSVRREGTQVPIVRNVDVQGFRWTIPSELAPALACALAVVGFLLAWVSPLRRLLARMAGALSRGIEDHFKGRMPGWTRNRVSSALRNYTLDAPLPEFASVRVAVLGSVIALGSLCAVMTIREELLSAELDLLLWWLGTSLAFALSAFVLSAVHWRYGLVKSVVCGLHALAHQLPLLALIASIAVVTRTSRLSDIVRFQKGWPQEWLLVHDPALCVSAMLAFVALIPEVIPPSVFGTLAATTVPRVPSASMEMLSFVVNRLQLWVQSILLTMLVLGGWSVPGVEYSSSPSTGIKIIAIILLLTKVSVVTAAASIIRWSLGAVRQQHTIGWVLRWGLPISLGATLTTLAWNYCLRHWSITWADSVMHFVVMGLVVATATLLAVQTRSRLRNGTSMTLVSPWI